MKTHIETGMIQERDYGVVVKRRYDKFFFSPFKYALGKLMLETPEQINTRLELFADENSLKRKEVKDEFRKGIRKKEKLTRLMDIGQRDTLFNLQRYGQGISAEAISKSDKNQKPYGVDINELTIENIYGEFMSGNRRCECKDSRWSDVKKKTLNCMHLSALELALYYDNKSRESVEDNLSALLPKERPNPIILPFQIGINPNLDLILTQSLWDYYVEDTKQFNINKALLENPQIYTQILLKTLNQETFDRAEYQVLRQSEEKKSKSQITESERRFYAASNALEERIIKKLDTLGFKFRAYGLEFKGTKDEITAKRFQNRNQVISVVIPENMPPIMIKKYLSAKVNPSFGYISKPLDFTQRKYEDIDDVTRRETINVLFIPGEKEGTDIFVPEILKERYAKLK